MFFGFILDFMSNLAYLFSRIKLQNETRRRGTLQIMSPICDSAAKKGIETENNGNGMSEDIIHANDEDRFHNCGYKQAINVCHKSVHRAILLLLEK